MKGYVFASAFLLASPSMAAPFNCFGPGADALKRGRGGPALAAFQAAFSHPDCRHQRGGLLLNMGAAFDRLAEETGEARYACAAAVRYRAVGDEPASPRMLAAAQRGARAADARCGTRQTIEGTRRAEMGLDEVLSDDPAPALATTLTIGAIGALAAGGVFLALAAERDEQLQEANAELSDATTAADANRAIRKAGDAHADLTRDEVLGVTLLSVGGTLAMVSIWAWLDLSDNGLAFAPSPGGAVVSGVW